MAVTEKDLIGEIKDFPIEIVEKMIERQMEQGNKADVSVFQRTRFVGASSGGFTWTKTTEDEDEENFWRNVISCKNFDIFFRKYPKEEDYWIDPKGRRMLVWDEEQAKERIVIAKLPSTVEGHQYIAVSEAYEREFKEGRKYRTIPWTYAKPIPTKTKLTLSTIAEKFGLKEDEIEIDFDK